MILWYGALTVDNFQTLRSMTRFQAELGHAQTHVIGKARSANRQTKKMESATVSC